MIVNGAYGETKKASAKSSTFEETSIIKPLSKFA
jgi:hypothetical protein